MAKQPIPKQPLPLAFNCGYARTAIRTLTLTSKANHKGVVHKDKRKTDFKKLFDIPTYQLHSTLLNTPEDKNRSYFDKMCEKVHKLFSRSWNPAINRVKYTNKFSMDNWKALDDSEKAAHTLANCKACFTKHENLQRSFPAKPVYCIPPPLLVLDVSDQPQTKRQEKKIGRQVLQELDTTWKKRFGRKITPALPTMMPEANLTRKVPKLVKKKEDRTRKRTFVTQVNKQFAKNATMTLLAEAESISSYKRKRLSYSFETPPAPKRQKTHSPNEDNLTLDMNKVIETLNNFPSSEKINWSGMARKLGITQPNGGQVLKEIAQRHGIDTSRLEHSSETTPRTRRSKAKLQGREISMPCLPTQEIIKDEKKHLIDSGELSIGVPCTPYVLSKSIVNTEGNIEIKKVEFNGRKIPLTELRKSLLKKQETYMRVTTSDVNKMTKEQILTFMDTVHHTQHPDTPLDKLQTELKSIQQTRTLAIWHDHSTILQTGYILFAVWVVYDLAVFFTEAEYKAKTGKKVDNIQALIEEPEIYMIAPSSSSPVHQLALIGDRIECLHELASPIKTSKGLEIKDKLRFFCGDKPAQQFERGTQIGGTYKCGGCGCKDHMMQNLPHALAQPWRPLAYLQTLVTAGKYGRTPGLLKPMDSLKVNELREELQTRGFKGTTENLKPELQEKLSSTLRGAQRVPTLLTLDPMQSLSNINLEDYEVLDCEPLHDIKGHLHNLLPEIPPLLQEPLKKECEQILQTTIPKQSVSGAVLRSAAIKLLLKLLKAKADKRVLALVETIVRISEILYMRESKRSPKTVLRLYNCTWLHHELCNELLPSPKFQTLHHLFGIYLHALTIHAPIQHQTMSLLSVNAENQERLFSQAKRVSLRSTNRKTENVLPTILISIQARQKMDDHKPIATKQEGIVRSVSSKLPLYKGTSIDKEFVTKHLTSWQAHLKRISTFLEPGKGTWWHESNEAFLFHDSDDDMNYRQEGPSLMHFRSATQPKVECESLKAWEKILHNKVVLPTPSIRVYDDNGDYTGTRLFTTSDTNPNSSITFPELTESEYDTITQNEETKQQNTEASLQEFDSNQQWSNSSPIAPSLATDTYHEEDPQDVEGSLIDINLHITSNMDSDPEPIPPTLTLQTKAAKAILRVTGPNNNLVELDFLRHKLKCNKALKKQPSETDKEEYAMLLKQLHDMVNSSIKQAIQAIRDYETTHYHKYNIFPDQTKEEYKQLRKKLDNARNIYSIWSTFKIT